MSKHSPGPWKWVDDVLMSNVDSEDHWDRAVMDCPSAQWPPHEADKRLIAAAPEMLELLRRLSVESFDAENAAMDGGCAVCGGGGYHVGECALSTLLKCIDGEA